MKDDFKIVHTMAFEMKLEYLLTLFERSGLSEIVTEAKSRKSKAETFYHIAQSANSADFHEKVPVDSRKFANMIIKEAQICLRHMGY